MKAFKNMKEDTKDYKISFDKMRSFFNTEPLNVDIYKWADNNYTPKVEVFLCHDNTHLVVKFFSYEKQHDLRTLVKEDSGPVCQDSCVEFFFQPYPDDPRYINFEVTPLGFLSMSLRKDRYETESLLPEYRRHINIVPHIEPDHWTVHMEIPFSFIALVFEKQFILKSGDTAFANFYKCGDKTTLPHFGMWNDITLEDPDFHQSCFFGKIFFA